MDYKIETIEGIGKVVGDKLRANGEGPIRLACWLRLHPPRIVLHLP